MTFFLNQNIRIVKQKITLLFKAHFIKISENVIRKNLPVTGFCVTRGSAVHEKQKQKIIKNVCFFKYTMSSFYVLR